MTTVTQSMNIDLRAMVGGFKVEADLEVRGTVALIGPNGAGKTTLLRALLGVCPANGRLSIGDSVLLDSTLQIDLATEERHIGYVPQSYGLFPHLSVAQNLRFALTSRHHGPRKQIELRIEALLERFSLSALRSRRPGSLSGGERQRTAIARAVASEPQVLLFDEPLAALDRVARQEVRGVLADYLAEARLPALVVTHEPADAFALADTVVVLEEGHVAEVLSLDDTTSASSPFAQAFFGQ